MNDQRAEIHKDHMDLLDYEDHYMPVGAATFSCQGRWTGLTVEDMEELADILEVTQSPRLLKLQAFVRGALRWALRNPGKVKP